MPFFESNLSYPSPLLLAMISFRPNDDDGLADSKVGISISMSNGSEIVPKTASISDFTSTGLLLLDGDSLVRILLAVAPM